MKYVIDVPDNYDLSNIKNGSIASQMILNAVKNGKAIPKGHGDLVDRDDLLAESYCIDDWMGNEVNIVDVMTIKMADTIIEADKE